MKPSSTHGVSRPIRVVSSTWLAVVLCVMAGSASAALIAGGGEGDIPPPAPPVVYVPHPELTPYQLVADNGKCVQSPFEPMRHGHAPTWGATLADCDDSNSLQKFYVLDYSTQSELVTDFVPQTDGAPGQATGANARIALTAPLDSRGGRGYSFMYVDDSGAPNVTAVGNDNLSAYPWRVTKSTPDLADGHGWAKMADKGGGFTLTGYEPRQAFYGVWGQAPIAQGQLTMNQFLGGNLFQCGPSMFGSRSSGSASTQASCYVQAASSTDTPLRVSISYSANNQCLVRNADGSGVGMGGCTTQGSSNSYTPAAAAWTLRPTPYTNWIPTVIFEPAL